MQGGRLERTLEMTILIRALNQTTGAFSGIGLAATAAFMAVGAALAYSVKQAADFQTGLTVLSTGAGELQSNLQMVGDGIKQISIETGTTTDQLLKGMFMIDSAGYTAAKGGLTILKTAAEGARLENTDLGQTAFALTGLLHNYGMGANQATGAMNALIATEKDGKMKMVDLTTSLAQVLPIASSLGVSFPEVGAAMDLMTNSSMKARQSAQNLNFLLRGLAREGSTAASASALTEVGLTADQVTNTLRGPDGIMAALTLIIDAISKKFPVASNAWNNALADLTGGATGWRTALMLTHGHISEYLKDMNDISGAMKNAKGDVSGWALMQQTFNFQLDQTKAALNVAAIDIGTILIPVLEKALAWITPLIGQFTNWVQTSPDFQNAVNNVATAIGNATQFVVGLVQDAVNLYQAFQQGQAWAIALAIALGALGSAILLLKIAEFAAGVWQAVAAWGSLGGLISGIGRYLISTFFPSLTIAITDLSIATGVSATAITLTLAAATAGISLLIGAVIAAIAYAAVNGQNAMSQATKQAYDSLGQTSDDMKAKAQADAAVAQVSWQAAADNTTSRWQNTGEQVARASADARAKYIIDQQKMADAAEKAAQAADQAWTKASQDMNIVALLLSQGWSPGKIKQYLAGSGTNTEDMFPSSAGMKHHASGIMNSPYGHMATLAEQGGEWMYIPSPTTGYVPQGASVFPHGAGPGGGTNIYINVSTMAGSRSEVMRMVDMIEQELAARFRSQTSSFSLRGLA